MSTRNIRQSPSHINNYHKGKRMLHLLKGWLHDILVPISIIIFFLFIIEIVIHAFHISSYLFPAPTLVLSQLINRWDTISFNLKFTIIAAVGGFVIATILAILVATVFVHFRLLERVFYPFAVVLQTIPIIIITPVLIVLFGNGLGPKILIAAIITFFPTLVNMTRGLLAVDPLALDLFAIMNASKYQTFMKLRFPTALPYLFSSLKIASVNCFIGAIVAEWISADRGIGYLAQINLYQLNIDRLYAAVLASSITAILFSGLVGFSERVISKWQIKNSETNE